jgi:hypothetical protein
VDDDVNEALTHSDFATAFFKPEAVLGSLPMLLGAATTIYVWGRTNDAPRVSRQQ